MFTLAGQQPSEGSKRNDVNSLIEFTIVDDGNGINSSTLLVFVNDKKAIDGYTFLDGYSGLFSEINPVGNNLGVVIHPEESFIINSVVSIKIQFKDFLGKFINFKYSFKIIENKPYLFDSSPKNLDNLISPQKLFLDIRDDSSQINLSSLIIKLNKAIIFQSNNFVSSFDGADSEVSLPSEDNVVITIDPKEFLRDGSYILEYSIKNIDNKILTGSLKFNVKYTAVPLPDIFPQGGFVGFFQGIKEVKDLGNGSDLYISWSKPASRFYNSDIYCLIYKSTDRLTIFDSHPSFVVSSDKLEATLNGFDLGVGYYFAVRAMETYKNALFTGGMTEIDEDIFLVPDKTFLLSEISEEDAIIAVSSTDGFPDKGLLRINNEIIRYVSIDRSSNSFLIPSDGRGLSGSTASYHDSSDEVSMFFSCQDSNNSIIYGTCSFQDQESTGRQYNGIGLIVPDFSDFEKMTHDGLDHCGYHKPLPWEALSGKNDCGTYLGGEYNGFRGIDIYQRALDREEELMENVGEKCVLLVRKWAGETCSCITLRRQNPKLRTCKFCFGTGIVGGYEQYINRRRADNRVMVRFYETPENLAFGDHQHLNQDFKPSALALYKPIIKDRDVVIRFDYTDDIEYIYEVLDVSRERFVFNKYGRQKINLQRMDKTDILYQFPFIKT